MSAVTALRLGSLLLQQLPSDTPEGVAQGWIDNPDALAIGLRELLLPPEIANPHGTKPSPLRLIQTVEVEAIEGFGSVSSWREGVQFIYCDRWELPDGDQAGDTAPACRLQMHELTDSVGNKAIRDSLRNRPGVPAAHIRQLVRKQGQGSPSGLLHVDGKINIFDHRSLDGRRWFIGIWWNSASKNDPSVGWYINNVPATDLEGHWGKGDMVLSVALP